MKLARSLSAIILFAVAAAVASAQVQVAKVNAAVMGQGYSFGNSVSISGDTAIVGEPGDSSSLPQAGSAFVLQRSGSSWVLVQQLTASQVLQGVEFGASVAIDGDIAVIGTPFESAGAGAAYVFERVQSRWSQVQRISAQDAQADAQFGTVLAISGDRIVVGAQQDSQSAGLDSGAAYVFERTGSTWFQVKKLLPNDPTQGAGFGSAVAIDGDYAVIGSPSAGGYLGAAHVFYRSASGWTQTQKLTASDAQSMDSFGFSTAVSGDTIMIG